MSKVNTWYAVRGLLDLAGSEVNCAAQLIKKDRQSRLRIGQLELLVSPTAMRLLGLTVSGPRESQDLGEPAVIMAAIRLPT